ncbi:MAG: CoA ester lyase, partial [Actinobacteria bacterium]|nr:CoA ester lyase [Actinomycetota bacterium]NIU69897.1 CoA ester lyase [Actinomycetota bacterium]NIW31775.1 CoA ester lyase [Actinomycetota bacterium]
VMVPKATAREVDLVAASPSVDGIALVALIESGEGLLDARDIAAHPAVTRLAVGEADLAADLDMEAGDDDPAWLPSRMQLVWASAAAGLEGPIGPVFIDLRDL